MTVYNPDEFREAIAAHVKLMFDSQKAAAKHWHISEQYLCDFLQGRREPGAKLLRGLNAAREIRYRWGI